MKFVVAIDSLKGCLSSVEANHAARAGLLRVNPEADVVCVPVGDGGEGFLAAVNAAVGGQFVDVEVYDPLKRPIRAQYLIYMSPALVTSDAAHSQGPFPVACIEVAQASGLCLLSPEERNPLIATSYGTGQIIADALRRGIRDFVVGLGGSATSDCGQGMMQALKDEFGEEGVSNLRGAVRMLLATDVRNPLLGLQGAAHVFAVQKGATPEMVEILEHRAGLLVRENAVKYGFDCSHRPGAGAAGGMGYTLMQTFEADCTSGAEWLLNMGGFDTLLRGTDFVITGEGCADRQTLMGKLPSVILRRVQQLSQALPVPVWLVAGQVKAPVELEVAGFHRVFSFNPPNQPLSYSMRPDVARQNLAEAIQETLRNTL